MPAAAHGRTHLSRGHRIPTSPRSRSSTPTCRSACWPVWRWCWDPCRVPAGPRSRDTSAACPLTCEQADARDRWRHEDELINQRLTWLLSAHALLGAGYAWLRYRVAEVRLDLAAQDKPPQSLRDEVPRYLAQLDELMGFLALVGLGVTLLVGLGIVAACMAQNRLKRDHPGLALGVSRLTTNLGRCTALAVPAACLLGWVHVRGFGLPGGAGLALVSLGVIVALLLSLERPAR